MSFLKKNKVEAKLERDSLEIELRNKIADEKTRDDMWKEIRKIQSQLSSLAQLLDIVFTDDEGWSEAKRIVPEKKKGCCR